METQQTTKQIYVSQKDIYEFTKTFRRGKLYWHWINLIKEMPEDLKAELRSKPTNLVEKTSSASAIIYQFITLNASPELAGFLDEYKVLVSV